MAGCQPWVIFCITFDRAIENTAGFCLDFVLIRIGQIRRNTGWNGAGQNNCDGHGQTVFHTLSPFRVGPSSRWDRPHTARTRPKRKRPKRRRKQLKKRGYVENLDTNLFSLDTPIQLPSKDSNLQRAQQLQHLAGEETDG
jgi:hypothetical protein